MRSRKGQYARTKALASQAIIREPKDAFLWQGRYYFRRTDTSRHCGNCAFRNEIADVCDIINAAANEVYGRREERPLSCSDGWVYLPTSRRTFRPFGAGHHAAKLDVDDVIELRKDYRSGLRGKALAKKWGISTTSAWLCATYKTWKHVP